MLREAQKIKEQLIHWRRQIHQHPELGFEVYRTAELVAAALDGLGIETRVGVGKSGVVGYLGDGDGPVIAIRADMDALPIEEETAVEYASQIPGYMHACGHDAHTAVLLGVATLLSRRRLPGQVRLIFQPSEETHDEEGLSGAPRMIADGALDGVDAVISLHVDGTVETGRIVLDDGPVDAAIDTFRAWVIGSGGHGAYPDQTIDPIWLTAHVLQALYAIPSRRVKPLQPSVLSVGIVRGGTAENIIPNSVYLEGTLRSYDEGVREQLLREVENALKLTHAFGGAYDLSFVRGYPASVNDPEVAAWLRQVGGEVLAPDGVSTGQKSMGSEDFGYMTQAAPGAMFHLGVRPPGAAPRYLHTSTFDVDEDALPIGVAMLAETALRFVHQEWS